VRKDLSFFGSFGKRGLGYPVPELADRLREILGLKQRYQVALIGAGKIGSALVQYRGFRQRGFDIIAIFDSDASKVGRQWNGLTVLDIAQLESEFAQARQREARAAHHRHRSGPVLGHPDRQLRQSPVGLADDQDNLVALAPAAPDFDRCAAAGVEAVADHHLVRLIVGIMRLPRRHRAPS